MSSDAACSNASAAAAASAAKPTHLAPSKLGTKQYWDDIYTTELTNHAANPEDEGTVWFDDSDAEAKILSFLDETAERGDYGIDRRKAAVLDLGCGNGSLLFALRDDGWAGQLRGVDYSPQSVALARKVDLSRRRQQPQQQQHQQQDEEEEEEEEEEKKEVEEGENEGVVEVDFKVWDVLRGPLDDVRVVVVDGFSSPAAAAATTEKQQEGENGAGYDLVLDKGTFDAVSLSDERDAQGRRVCERYGARVFELLRPGGVFLVTSCNWTETELREWFEGTETGSRSGDNNNDGATTTVMLRKVGRIEYPSFSFGGVKGQTISTLCFEKVVVGGGP
ncbi:S-adenosyl-L-methionine-dependent methyltransferase [Podospora didyma]|uniref:Protein-lysine N-methyltransferase EFM4 n=1 Tax=Podospora didyma TaxID=330526 RepID=A0AAE0N263_9PEZI|nr:S-adenosyl-L-methionine-dependent methyltransferase [Podospora didyma]